MLPPPFGSIPTIRTLFFGFISHQFYKIHPADIDLHSLGLRPRTFGCLTCAPSAISAALATMGFGHAEDSIHGKSRDFVAYFRDATLQAAFLVAYGAPFCFAET